MSKKAWLNLLVAAVLPIAVCAFLFVSYDVLWPLSLATLALAFVADRGLKGYALKLEAVVSTIEAARAADRPKVLKAKLSPLEMRLWGIATDAKYEIAAGILRRREKMLLACGAPVRMVGVTAAIVLLLLFFDFLDF